MGEYGYGKKGVKYSYYKCAARKRKHGSDKCTLKTHRKDVLEDFVVLHTINDVLQDDVIAYLADRVMEIQERDTVNLRLEQLTAALKENERAIHNVMKAIEQGIITASTKQRLMELEAQAEDLKAHIAREELKKPLLTKEHIIFWLNLFRMGDVSDPDFKQRLIDVFVHSVYV